MIKGLAITICTILVLILSALLVMTLFNEYVMQNSTSKTLRTVVQIFMPPRDLFIPLVRADVDISNDGTVREITYTNKYLGKHSLILAFQRVPENFYFSQFKPALQIQFQFFIDGRKVLTRSYEGVFQPFVGKDKKGGIILAHYNCPEDLPINKPITLRIEVIKADLELSKIAGWTEVLVRKESDL